MFYFEAVRAPVDTKIQPNTNTTLDFPIITRGDALGQWDGTKFTATAACIISLHAHIHWRDMQQGRGYNMLLILNGAVYWKQPYVAATNSWKDGPWCQTMELTFPAIQLAADDQLLIQINHNCDMPCEIGQSIPNTRLVICSL